MIRVQSCFHLNRGFFTGSLPLKRLFFLILLVPVPPLFFLIRHIEHAAQQSEGPSSGPGCVGWKGTLACLPFGPLDQKSSRTCTDEVRGGSGYCLCEGNVTTARVSCGYHRIRCKDACAALGRDGSAGLPLPQPLTCGNPDAGGSGSAALLLSQQLWNGEWQPGRLNMTQADAASRSVWAMFSSLVARHAPAPDVRVPEPRSSRVDWVLEGRAMDRGGVEALANTFAGLLADLPPYPDGGSVGGGAGSSSSGGGGGGGGGSGGAGGGGGAVFSGRGVVMVGGSLRYLVPAWVSLHVLRRSGCRLPVEVWFPAAEYPTPELEAALAALGATARRLELQVDPMGAVRGDGAGSSSSSSGSGSGSGDSGSSGGGGATAAAVAAANAAVPGAPASPGYGYKVAALLMSSFREVLFLDSDNAVLRDPTYLFDSPAYRDTGALLWPDWWSSTAAKEAPRILNVSASRMPHNTFESGQMVLDKARHWRGLLIAAYMNMHGRLFWELLHCYVGKGDKETFAYGMLAAGEPYWVSPVPAGSVGLEQEVCLKEGRGPPRCRRQFLGNTMLQHDPDGEPLFLHANYYKWKLELPQHFEADWHRRWQVVQPGRRAVAEVLYGNTTAGAGYDLERFIYDAMSALRCAPWLPRYLAARQALGEVESVDLEGFHPLPFYTNIRDFYWRGWRGTIAPLAWPPLGWRDYLTGWYFSGPRWWIRGVWRRGCVLRRHWLPLRPRWLQCKELLREEAALRWHDARRRWSTQHRGGGG
ncbi:hypothetical protein CHLRE_02g102750v5 [Chlamydomonas reinhardtii]|uniref:Uncharacterized protein n=1 Tax=Chlamydomonas reinhardtii TaxID=3055 RepID=A0A2K3E2F0_CHLRE|nr:uncharacterized protein CHLRE_02g102750v5 [Chlamydomonas reinhardtii]PNW86953.1 hypothetical protein CHLRE_02g102750v5 [Chlamydomonas reinhardtii]